MRHQEQSVRAGQPQYKGNLGGAGAVLTPFRMSAFYAAGMREDTCPGEDKGQHEELPALPRHLSALIGSLRGPALPPGPGR